MVEEKIDDDKIGNPQDTGFSNLFTEVQRLDRGDDDNPINQRFVPSLNQPIVECPKEIRFRIVERLKPIERAVLKDYLNDAGQIELAEKYGLGSATIGRIIKRIKLCFNIQTNSQNESKAMLFLVYRISIGEMTARRLRNWALDYYGINNDIYWKIHNAWAKFNKPRIEEHKRLLEQGLPDDWVEGHEP